MSRYFLNVRMLFVGLLVAAGPAIAADEIKLVTQLGVSLNDKGKPFIACAFQKMGRSHTVTEMPWARAQLGTKEGIYDGFFMATKNSKRDRYAVFSEPFMKIKWLYVVRKDSNITPDDPDFKDRISGANNGSSRHTWLTKKFKEKVFTRKIVGTTDSKGTIKMLQLGRIEVALENESHLGDVFIELAISPSDFKTFVARERPMSVYFGKVFLKREPEFLDVFNKNMRACK